MTGGLSKKDLQKQVKAYLAESLNKMHSKPKRLQFNRLYLQAKDDLRILEEGEKNGNHRN